MPDENATVPTPEGSGQLDGGAAGGAQVLAGRYELLGLLGVGGMGSVYRARDTELDEIVALKMLRRELVSTKGVLDRFRQEVKLARKVTHTNVARTFDIGEHAGEKFLTMELIEGESLAALLARSRTVALDRFVTIVEAVCSGLDAAHAAGVVHRDLKPDNVLLEKNGRIAITDFGIARALSLQGQQTMGAPIGTPAYMAPEQVEASANIDARADIYALGAMMFEMITGELAWKGSSAYAVAAARLFAPPPDPREHARDLPDAVARIIQKAMARQPQDRFGSAEELAEQLAQITLPAAFAAGPSVERTAVRASLAPRIESRHAPAPPDVTGELPAGHKSVAVLPLKNAGSAEDLYLAEGITEDLIDTLSMNRKLRVRSLASVLAASSSDGDPREIGRALDVQVVAAGSIRPLGATLRVTVRLISVADGFQIWAKRFDRPRAEVLAIADEAAAAMAEALDTEISDKPHIVLTNPVAIDLYLRGRYEMRHLAPDSSNRAVVLFEEALTHAPDDPTLLAWFALAMSRVASNLDRSDCATRAHDAAKRALTLAPHMGEAHLALATLSGRVGDAVGAAREVRRAVECAPLLADANETMGRFLIEIGRVDEGIERMETAARLDPTAVSRVWEIARAAALVGDWDRATEMTSGPPSDYVFHSLYWLNRGRIQLWRGDDQAARASFREIANRDLPNAALLRAFIELVATPNETTVLALRTAAALPTGARRRSFGAQLKAEFSAYAGDGSFALDQLEEAERAGLIDILWLDKCPLFTKLREEPRFRAVKEHVARRAAAVELALVGSIADGSG